MNKSVLVGIAGVLGMVFVVGCGGTDGAEGTPDAVQTGTTEVGGDSKDLLAAETSGNEARAPRAQIVDAPNGPRQAAGQTVERRPPLQ
jgi:hypothetical protein